MVLQDYIIHSSEGSDGPGRTKTKMQKKKKGGKKQKAERVKAATASQGSEPELLDHSVTEPIQKPRTKQMSRERQAEPAADKTTSPIELWEWSETFRICLSQVHA